MVRNESDTKPNKIPISPESGRRLKASAWASRKKLFEKSEIAQKIVPQSDQATKLNKIDVALSSTEQTSTSYKADRWNAARRRGYLIPCGLLDILCNRVIEKYKSIQTGTKVALWNVWQTQTLLEFGTVPEIDPMME